MQLLVLLALALGKGLELGLGQELGQELEPVLELRLVLGQAPPPAVALRMWWCASSLSLFVVPDGERMALHPGFGASRRRSCGVTAWGSQAPARSGRRDAGERTDSVLWL